MRYILNTLFILILFTSCLLAQVFSPYQLRSKSARPSTDYTLVPKKSGHYTAEDWAAVIDTTWGPGLPTNQKLAIFDEAWNKIDAEFAAFQGLDIDWDSLRTLYRNQIDSTTSRGRFAAIMSYMILALEEVHSYIWDAPVFFTPLEPGVPLLYLGGNAESTSHFGATLTPLPDSSLLVLKTVSSHPLGLVPGDKVLGYDGILWKDLIKELLSFQLPIYLGWCSPASDKISNSHNLLCGAGMNWHLFDTLDVVKYATGDTMYFPTASLAGQNEFIWGNEQLPVPGVDWIYDGTANIQDPLEFGDYISWGVVDNSNIGYIYAVAWFANQFHPGTNVSQQFYDAIYNLMLVQNVDGLIIDQRLNYGGQFKYQQGFSLLYNSTFRLFGYDERSGDPNNHYQMSHYAWVDQFLTTQGDPMTFYDRPVAVLTGPVSTSGGDVFALTIKSHPMARLFGKPTNGAFSTYPGEYNLDGNTDWTMSHTNSNGYLLDNPGNYLSRKAFIPDEEVWFTQDDVANGDDTVVKRAIEWIQNLAYAHDVAVDKINLKPVIDEVTISAKVENLNNHTLSVLANISLNDTTIVDSVYLSKDGVQGDSIWRASWSAPEENIYHVSVKTDDPDAGTSRTIPNVAHFTTIGPVTIGNTLVLADTIRPGATMVPVKLLLRNMGTIATASDIYTQIFSIDTSLATIPILTSPSYGNILPGDSAETNVHHYIDISESCPVNIDVFFKVVISSNRHVFWSDTFYVRIDSVVTSVRKEDLEIPKEFALKQNYPNPFNPKTEISYQLSVNSEVDLSIYNLLGQKVATLVNENQPTGNYKVEWNGSGFASGLYYYRLETDKGFVQTKKLILLK